MTTPTFTNIFQLYYRLFRAEANVPDTTDDEYIIGMSFANEAVAHWSGYDGMYWSQLFATAQTASTGGVVTITTGTSSYAAPTAFREAGGSVKIRNSAGQVVRTYSIIQPSEAQFASDDAQYAYFTSVAGGTQTLHLNPAPDAAINGLAIDYVYYAKPTEFTTGASTTECPNAEYVATRMLYHRMRAARNPLYTDMLRDSENQLAAMKMDNDSGSWANPWTVPDNSGSIWGN